MAGKEYRSKCCGAKVKTDGMSDFIGSSEICTMSLVCLQCKKGCDAYEVVEININDDIEVRLTAKGKRLFKAYRRKYYPGIVIPSYNSRGQWFCFQLSDFMHIFGNEMRIGAESVIVNNEIRILKQF